MDRFLFRETHRDWRYASIWLAFSVFVAMTVFRQTHNMWLAVAVLVVEVLASSAFPRWSLSVTRERVTYRRGISIESINMRDISSCQFEALPVDTTGSTGTATARLWITKRNGKHVSFELRDAQLACSLIESAIAECAKEQRTG